MLAIDITDKQIRLARGAASGTAVRIDDVDTREISDGAVVNGYITDISMVAGEIIELISAKGIVEKEVVVCINSSSVINKELEIPRPKSLKNTAAIEAMVTAQMGVTGEYVVTYSILKEFDSDEGQSMLKIQAYACPEKMVESYDGLLTQLGFKQKHIILSGCIAVTTLGVLAFAGRCSMVFDNLIRHLHLLFCSFKKNTPAL